MYFFLKYIVILFYKKLRIKIVVCLLRESGPRWVKTIINQNRLLLAYIPTVQYVPTVQGCNIRLRYDAIATTHKADTADGAKCCQAMSTT